MQCLLFRRTQCFRGCLLRVLHVLCYCVLATFSFSPVFCRGSLCLCRQCLFPGRGEAHNFNKVYAGLHLPDHEACSCHCRVWGFIGRVHSFTNRYLGLPQAPLSHPLPLPLHHRDWGPPKHASQETWCWQSSHRSSQGGDPHHATGLRQV